MGGRVGVGGEVAGSGGRGERGRGGHWEGEAGPELEDALRLGRKGRGTGNGGTRHSRLLQATGKSRGRLGDGEDAERGGCRAGSESSRRASRDELSELDSGC